MTGSGPPVTQFANEAEKVLPGAGSGVGGGATEYVPPPSQKAAAGSPSITSIQRASTRAPRSGGSWSAPMPASATAQAFPAWIRVEVSGVRKTWNPRSVRTAFCWSKPNDCAVMASPGTGTPPVFGMGDETRAPKRVSRDPKRKGESASM